MRAARQQRNPWRSRTSAPLLALLLTLITTTATASTQLVLARGGHPEQREAITGVVDLAVDPGFPNARVTVAVDGHTVAANLMSPYHVNVDFGPLAVEKRITVTARSANGKQVRWTETINQGMLPLTLRLKPVDPAAGIFEAHTTAPKDDPVESVSLWHEGNVLETRHTPPWRFEVPPVVMASGYVQVTAKSRSGEEIADFWSAAGNMHSAELQIRTVPIFVSVVDRNGVTRDDVDRSLFRIIDGEAEATIVEFGKAFDQPISIALLVDASASMTYSMQHAAKAAAEFAARALKEGDRCSVTAVQDVPRRRQALTGDRAAISASLKEIVPQGRTALYDAVASAIRELREEKNRRAIVVLTDGTDTASNWSYTEVEKLARVAAIPIYFIAYQGGGDHASRDLDRLRYLAAQTGGFVATATQQNLLAKYEAIEKDLRAQFAIKYQVSDFGKSNEWRPVRVVMDSSKLMARTIQGYFTP